MHVRDFANKLNILIVCRCIIRHNLDFLVFANNVDLLGNGLVDFGETVVLGFCVEQVVLFAMPSEAAHVDDVSVESTFCF